jgi:HEPN domain-containing protein
MRPPEEAIQSLALEWCAKGNADFDAAVHLMREGARFREIVYFHSQQAAEKYLKALLVRHQLEFPKTHDIKDLLDLLNTVHPAAAEALRDAEFLTPFGVKIRYPGDFPDTLPDAEKKAVDLAGRVKGAVTALLNP